jgi:trehalose 6-phosphate phosphatase
VVVEDKGEILAFHYRRADVEADALAAIRSAIASSETAKHFAVQEGRKVYELRPPLQINKGTAARELAERMGAKAVLAMGDDVTDLLMFEAVRAMPVPSVVVGVWNEEWPEVVESGDYFVRGVPGVEWLLDEMVRIVKSEE